MTLILIGLGSGGCSLSRPDAYARMDAANVTGSLSKPNAGWPVGKYRVDLSIDGKVVGTAHFKISKDADNN